MKKPIRMNLYATQPTINFISVLSSPFDTSDEVFPFSSGAVLSIEALRAIVTTTKLSITANELLFCCAALNGGAHLSQYMTPDAGTVIGGIESMVFSIKEAFHYEAHTARDFDVSADKLLPKIEAMSVPELITLAFATNHFWKSGKTPIDGLESPNTEDGWQGWAAQFVLKQ